RASFGRESEWLFGVEGRPDVGSYLNAPRSLTRSGPRRSDGQTPHGVAAWPIYFGCSVGSRAVKLDRGLERSPGFVVFLISRLHPEIPPARTAPSRRTSSPSPPPPVAGVATSFHATRASCRLHRWMAKFLDEPIVGIVEFGCSASGQRDVTAPCVSF